MADGGGEEFGGAAILSVTGNSSGKRLESSFLPLGEKPEPEEAFSATVAGDPDPKSSRLHGGFTDLLEAVGEPGVAPVWAFGPPVAGCRRGNQFPRWLW